MNINYFGLRPDEKCDCGKCHIAPVDDVIVENGAVNKLPEVLHRYNAKKVFVISDVNTNKAAGEKVIDILEKSGFGFSQYIFPEHELMPNEHAVGAAMLHYDTSCDTVVAVGSGVINDISKIVSNIADKPYIIVATAPSMDGYASPTSSMARAGLKVSVNSKCANVIIGDIDIIKEAPMRMLRAGLGDMLAKYVSICEWNIANIISGEYYCEKVAELIRYALKRCVDNADGLLKRDEEAVKAVFEGLVIGGIAMAYAGVSRPASGVEHYFAHIWDMRALEYGYREELHGIECAIGTLYASKLYERIKTITPNKQKALDYVKSFSFEKWSQELTEFCGKSAQTMLMQEEKEQKYNVQSHTKRIDRIIENWDRIITTIEKEMPSSEYIENLLDKIGAPKTVSDIGFNPEIVPMTFKSTKDIRDKYVLSRLAWDLGVLDELAATL